MIFIALCSVILIGMLSLRLLTRNQLPLLLQFSLGTCIGFCFAALLIVGQMLVFNNFNRWITIILTLLPLGTLLGLNYRRAYSKPEPLGSHHDYWIIAAIVCAITIPLVAQSTSFPLGGWDAWSCWNLKAKFLFLSQEHYKDMFAPELWRTNTHYPLLLPSIITFGWQWIGNASQAWPMLCSIAFALTILLLLMSTLRFLGVSIWIAGFLSLSIFIAPFCTTLAISQYSDILIGLLSLSIFVCWFLRSRFPTLLWIIPLCIGCLSFTKTEGLVASVLLTALLVCADQQARQWRWLALVGLCYAPTIFFQLCLAPSNEAFINGLLSTTKPSSLERLQTILIYPITELIGLKWQGLWIILGLGLVLYWKNAFDRQRVWIGIFIGAYLSIVMGYYWLNTFFEIKWWLDTTLHRICFALVPLIALWVGLSSKQE